MSGSGCGRCCGRSDLLLIVKVKEIDLFNGGWCSLGRFFGGRGGPRGRSRCTPTISIIIISRIVLFVFVVIIPCIPEAIRRGTGGAVVVG